MPYAYPEGSMNACRRYVISLAVMALALLAPLPAIAAPVGTFTKVEGKVDILRLSEIAAVPVQTGDPVSLGDAIRTKRNGKAEILFRDETVIQLAPETRITIDEYSFRGESTREKGLIGLFRGKMRAIVSMLKAAVVPVSRTDAGFNVKTPTAIAGVKGTDFVVYYERGVTGVIFIDGVGFVYNPGQPDRIVTVKGGQATFVRGEDPPLEARPVPTDMVLTDSSTLALADTSLGDGPGFSGDGASGPPFPGDPGALPPGPPGGVTNLIPITQTYPALLPTPVSLTVTIP